MDMAAFKVKLQQGVLLWHLETVVEHPYSFVGCRPQDKTWPRCLAGYFFQPLLAGGSNIFPSLPRMLRKPISLLHIFWMVVQLTNQNLYWDGQPS